MLRRLTPQKIYKWMILNINTLLKKKKYSNDPHYKINFCSIEKCFENRGLDKEEDEEILSRIFQAYEKATKDLEKKPQLFKPSNEWLPIYNSYLNNMMAVLKEKNIKKTSRLYKNFWRESCSRGLIGLPKDMEKSYFSAKKISFINKTLFLNDSFHRLNLWKSFHSDLDLNSLIAPLIGNPYGVFIDDCFIKSGADYQHHYATEIAALLKDKPSNKTVLEIGGGFGGMAYYLMRDNKDITYLDIDLPENLALTSYYLMKAFPDKNFLLYGEKSIDNINDYDAVLLPTFELDNLSNDSYDLFFNSYSLAEMSPETISHYISKVSKQIKNDGYLLHVNHTKHSLVSARDFPIPENFKLIKESLAEWNLGRNSNMDEYEFLFKKQPEQ